MTTTNITPFRRPPKLPPTRVMVRVVDIASPFFMWEGWVKEVGADDDGVEYARIACAHDGFQFPVLTFRGIN